MSWAGRNEGRWYRTNRQRERERNPTYALVRHPRDNREHSCLTTCYRNHNVSDQKILLRIVKTAAQDHLGLSTQRRYHLQQASSAALWTTPSTSPMDILPSCHLAEGIRVPMLPSPDCFICFPPQKQADCITHGCNSYHCTLCNAVARHLYY